MIGIAGPNSTSPIARSGWSAARLMAYPAPIERPATTARSVPVASSTATASATNSVPAYAAGPGGRSERPLPRPSNVTTRKWRAR